MKETRKENDITIQFMNFIIEELKNAPDSQIDEDVRSRVLAFDSDDEGEKYDFIVSISELDRPKISPFVKKLCDLKPYHSRPLTTQSDEK